MAGVSVTIFPAAMIWKKVEAKEAFDVKDLMEETIDTIERVFRNAR